MTTPTPQADPVKLAEESVTFLRPEVLAFALAMERELRANDHKGGWKDDSPIHLEARVREEALELRDVIRDHKFGTISADQTYRILVGSEAADVGNMAMMVADTCDALDVEEAEAILSALRRPAEKTLVANEPSRIAALEAEVADLKEHLARKTCEVPIWLLRDIFSYDPDTGLLTRKRALGTTSPGACNDGKNSSGYLTTRIKRSHFQQHRIIWAMVHGEWPAKFIDHINGNRSDNRIANLREADDWQNQWNARRRVNNTSGYRGVHKTGTKFVASIRHFGRKIVLGTFATAEEASAAYEAKSKELRGSYHIEQEPSAARAALSTIEAGRGR